METALALLTLLNAATPGVASLIMLIRRKDGTVSVAVLLDEADAAFGANIQQASDWLKDHPKV